jgi:PTH1 family peptidyl-tRNA hydrolase
LRLIVGLGNPGASYANTRHNVGIWVLEQAAARWAVRLRQRGPTLRGTGHVAGESVELAGTLDWMNLSGPPVKALLDEYHLFPEHLIVIHDDLDLETGRVRIKQAGGHGGHKGIQSIIEALGTPQFVRVKIGIGRPAPGLDAADYVLEPVSRDERTPFEEVVERAVLAVECVIERGVAAAMNEFNVREKVTGEEEQPD